MASEHETIFGSCPEYPPDLSTLPYHEGSQASRTEVGIVYDRFSGLTRRLIDGQEQLDPKVINAVTSNEHVDGFWFGGDLSECKASFKLMLSRPQYSDADSLFIEYAFTELAATEVRKTFIYKIDESGNSRCQQVLQTDELCSDGTFFHEVESFPVRNIILEDLEQLDYVYEQLWSYVIDFSSEEARSKSLKGAPARIGRCLRRLWQRPQFKD